MNSVRVAASALLVGSTLFASSAAASAASDQGCGATITSNTRLQADIGPCHGEGLIVASSGVKLDLNGHRVFGDWDEGNFAGIRLSDVRNVIVTGGSVEGFNAGILVFRGGHNTVQGVEVHDNSSAHFVADHPDQADFGDGILILSSSRNRILSNRVSNNGPYSGIGVLAETDPDTGAITGAAPADNLINNNTVLHNAIGKLCPASGRRGDGRVCPPYASVYNEDIGIRIEGPAAKHTIVTNNKVRRSGRDGIMVHNTFGLDSPPGANIPPNVDTLIANNDSEYNGAGVTIYDNDPNIGPVLGEGIVNRCYLNSPKKGCPVRTVIIGNTASHNKASGIDIAASENATIIDNVALFNNTDYTGTFVSQVNIPGPYLDVTDYHADCDNNTWLKNTFRTYDHPCELHHVGTPSVS